ncbi:unnamed protein product [Prorocentrum cordatum]|uniref:Uncharacterized protein n=1 Tax=Prorocentrum cordatum TaxID=2364126 RepID=A0ABN9Y2H6_9DINO|nr:unnamed protein product [Polarella glacialis]
MKIVLFRLAEAINAGQEQVERAADQGIDPPNAKQALQLIVKWGEQVSSKEYVVQATRCFYVLTKESPESEVECHRWIFAVNFHPELRQAFQTLRENGCLQALSIQLGKDAAPRSRAAQDVERLAFRSGGGKGGANAKAKKRARAKA